MKIKGFFSASVNIFIIAVVLAHSICAQKNTGKAKTPNKTTAKTAIEGVWNISFDSPAVHFTAAVEFVRHGTIVGTRTAGKMLASDFFSVGKTWMLQLPIADYRSCAGTRVEGRGVSPDIEVEGGDAAAGDAVLTKALSLLSKPRRDDIKK